MDTKGMHLLCDIWFDEPVDNKLVDKLTSVVDENLTVMNRSRYDFEPEGSTIAYILAESHFTVHTYPEHQYISMDIYICTDEIDLDGILEKMLSGIKVSKMTKNLVVRGISQD